VIIKYPNHNIKKLKITLAKAQQYALQHMLILTLYMHIQNEFILYVREVYRVSCNKGKYFLQIFYLCSSPTICTTTLKGHICFIFATSACTMFAEYRAECIWRTEGQTDRMPFCVYESVDYVLSANAVIVNIYSMTS